jgi:hypothetical protein
MICNGTLKLVIIEVNQIEITEKGVGFSEAASWIVRGALLLVSLPRCRENYLYENN